MLLVFPCASSSPMLVLSFLLLLIFSLLSCILLSNSDHNIIFSLLLRNLGYSLLPRLNYYWMNKRITRAYFILQQEMCCQMLGKKNTCLIKHSHACRYRKGKYMHDTSVESKLLIRLFGQIHSKIYIYTTGTNSMVNNRVMKTSQLVLAESNREGSVVSLPRQAIKR